MYLYRYLPIIPKAYVVGLRHINGFIISTTPHTRATWAWCADNQQPKPMLKSTYIKKNGGKHALTLDHTA